MKFSVFTASTPEWTPAEAARNLADQALEMLGDHLAHVHVKNVAWRTDGTRPDGSVGWRAEWSPLWSGQADLPVYFRALSTVGYNGWVTAEDFSVDVPLAERTRDNLVYLQSLRELTMSP